MRKVDALSAGYAGYPCRPCIQGCRQKGNEDNSRCWNCWRQCMSSVPVANRPVPEGGSPDSMPREKPAAGALAFDLSVRPVWRVLEGSKVSGLVVETLWLVLSWGAPSDGPVCIGILELWVPLD